jgi:hypothetical protein
MENYVNRNVYAFGLIFDKLNPACCIDVPREQFIVYRFRLYLATLSVDMRDIRCLYCPLTTDDLFVKQR